MLAENMPAALDGLAVVAAILLLVAFGLAAMLIWEDLQADLHARVEEDAEVRPVQPPYNWEIEEAI